MKIKFRHKNANTFKIEEFFVNGQNVKRYAEEQKYGTVFSFGGIGISIKLKDSDAMVGGNRYECSWKTPYAMATSLVKNLSVETQKDRRSTVTGDVIILSYKDVPSQSSYVLNSDQKNQERLDEVGFQLQVLGMIQDCLDGQPQGVYAPIPANVGLTDAGLNSIISAYNSLALERERMVANSSENNPRVQTLNTQLDIQKRSIQTTLSNLKKVYETKQLEVARQDCPIVPDRNCRFSSLAVT